MAENKFVVVKVSMTSTLCGEQISENKYTVGRVVGRVFNYVSDGIERKCFMREDMKVLGYFSYECKDDVEKLIKDFNVAMSNAKLECIYCAQNIESATALLRDARTISPLCSTIVEPGEKVLDNITNTVERVQMGANSLIEIFGRELAERKRKLYEIDVDFLRKLNRCFV